LGYISATGIPASDREVMQITSASGWVARILSSSTPVYPVPPTMPTLITLISNVVWTELGSQGT